MRSPWKTGLFVVLTFLWILAQPAQDARAKGPKGRGGGHGGGRSQASFGGGSHGGNSSGRSVKKASSNGGQGKVSRQTAGGNRLSTVDSGGEGSHPWSMQRANEERKLNHRMGVADKLDQIAERNGNANLRDVADRKREKAQQLYEKRMAKIDSKDLSLEPGDDLPDPPEPPSDPADEVSGFDDPDASDPDDDALATSEKLTGRENALDRQLRNEQRKLAKRMETAERLWDVYEETGDEELADVARTFEQQALTQYEKQVDAIGDFQQRHGLPEMIGDGLPPDDPLSGMPGQRLKTWGKAFGSLFDVLP